MTTPVHYQTKGFPPANIDWSELKLDDAMGRWERYIHDDAPDKLVQLAVLHAEFEALHPFLDGNGRLGRMLIPLVLWQNGLIHQPMFYLSAYLESHREEYYDRLLGISRDGDWTGWCAFFLKGIKSQADENHQKAVDILGLYERLKPQVHSLTRSRYAIHALDYVFDRPIFPSADFNKNSGIPNATARRLLPLLKEAGIVRVLQAGAGSRSPVLLFPELLNIAEGREVF